MRAICLLLLAIVLPLVPAAQNWKWISPYPTGADINSIWFTSNHTGYFVGIMGTILKTTDNGATWEDHSLSSCDTLNSVHFPDAMTGYAVGKGGVVIKTTDAGETWTRLVPGITNDLESVFFINDSTGFIAGYFGTLLKTTDGGATWQNISFTSTIHFTTINLLSPTFGLLGTLYHGIYRTTDGGITWQQSGTGPSRSYFSISFTDLATGYAVGADGLTGIIAKTTNSGATWTIDTLPGAVPCAVHFPRPDTGYIAGFEGAIWKTTNGGVSWTCDTLSGYLSLRSVRFSLPGTGYVAGDHGTILKTNDGGLNWSYPGHKAPIDIINDVVFTGPSTAFACGGKGYGNLDSAVIARTADAGETWTAMTLPDNWWLYALSFPTPDVGYAVSLGSVFKTADAGQTWTSFSFSPNDNLNSVSFSDPDHGIVVGKTGVLLRTTNGGATWTDMDPGTTNWYLDVFMVNQEVGYICGLGPFLRTTNGGASWSTRSSPCPNGTHCIFFTDELTGFAAGCSGIYKTTDGAGSWTYTDLQTYFNGLYFIDPLTGYAVDMEGTIFCTTDGGLTWNRQVSHNTGQLYAIAFADHSTGLAVGSGNILKTTNGGGVEIKEPVKQVGLVIRPNPAETEITVTLPGRLAGRSSDLLITDLTGRTVQTIHNPSNPSVIPVQSLQTGIYLVRWAGKVAKMIKR